MINALIHGHDRTLLGRIFHHPASNNLEWREVVAFVGRIGSTEEKRDDKWGFTVAGRTATFLRPRDKDMDPREVERLRHLMQDAGLSPYSTEILETSEVAADSGALIVIDHHEARIYRLDPETAGGEIETTLRPYDPKGDIHHLSHKEDGNHRGQRSPEDLGYFDRIAEAVSRAPRVAIVGHGTGKASAMAVLSDRLREHHHEIQGRVVATATIDLSTATDSQLLALGRRMLTRDDRS
ncbi:hypothetical protein FV226_18110 [Methylobacterium sp. WL12]|uniref:hypothetical protein n=1 Tax=Methylobacterium sp. WL12 TaxID=2603890 RepID=UPI0011CC6D24|nr:hypothetical protein [Methylobacterium sp. WL12]TXM69707.1 hypothetical protein FV226_18110 [Methylobacterium sp. WL12]TXN15966.1 hypothetical protein FV219_01150 [Methylobacterium sp. WL122]